MGNKQGKEKGMDGYKWSVVNVNNVALKTSVIIIHYRCLNQWRDRYTYLLFPFLKNNL